MRILNNSVEFDSKFATFSDFSKTSQFLFEKHICFISWNHFLNVLRSLFVSVASYNKIFGLGDFYKINFFFRKKPYILINVTKIWTFWEVLFFQSRFTASLLGSAIFWKKSTFFSKDPPFFFIKNLNFERSENFYYFSRILQQLSYIYCFFK